MTLAQLKFKIIEVVSLRGGFYRVNKLGDVSVNQSISVCHPRPVSGSLVSDRSARVRHVGSASDANSSPNNVSLAR